MDQFSKDLLKSWGLENFISRFEIAGIDKSILECLDDEMINNIFEKFECGYKKKFCLHFDEWKKNVSDQPPVFPSAIPTDNISANPPSSNSPFTNIDVRMDESNDSIQKNVCNSQISVISIIPSVQLSVIELLKSTTKGELILGKFKDDMTINTRAICDLLIFNEFDLKKNYRIKTERFLDLARQLSEIFATEKSPAEDIQSLFYFPYQKATKWNKCVHAGGALYEKYLNARKQLIKYGIISKKDILPEDIAYSELEENIEFLKNNDTPVNDIINKWKETFCSRERCQKNVRSYILSFKCLQSSFGHELLAYDFEKIYPSLTINFVKEWEVIAPLIIECAKKKKKLSSFNEVLITAGNEQVAAFLCLPRILGTIQRKRKNCDKSPYGITVDEVQNTFILCVESEEQFVSYKELRKEQNEWIGPYVAIIGDLIKSDDLDESDSRSSDLTVKVVIDNFEYLVESGKVSEAIDYCYKAFFALNTDFTIECRHVWTFIQEFFYKNGRTVKPYVVVNKFIAELSSNEK